MQMINDAVSPERLEIARELFKKEEAPSSEKKASDLDATLRLIHELEAELADKQEFAKKQLVHANGT